MNHEKCVPNAFSEQRFFDTFAVSKVVLIWNRKHIRSMSASPILAVAVPLIYIVTYSECTVAERKRRSLLLSETHSRPTHRFPQWVVVSAGSDELGPSGCVSASLNAFRNEYYTVTNLPRSSTSVGHTLRSSACSSQKTNSTCSIRRLRLSGRGPPF